MVWHGCGYGMVCHMAVAIAWHVTEAEKCHFIMAVVWLCFFISDIMQNLKLQALERLALTCDENMPIVQHEDP